MISEEELLARAGQGWKELKASRRSEDADLFPIEACGKEDEAKGVAGPLRKRKEMARR